MMQYTCDACKGLVRVLHGKQSLDALRLVHEGSCPAVLRVHKKR